ncbi:hypothetical protein HBI26_114950 [Parastagonospora nodorum]|nr:hypothetical protein HBI26_114950 [Parastagonospora nodorum]
MAHVDYSYGSTSACSGRSGQGFGGGGGGKRPPSGGQGSQLPVSPTKKRAPPAVRVVLEAIAHLLDQPLSADLADNIAAILADLLEQGQILPQFLDDIGRAYLHWRDNTLSDADRPYLITRGDPDDDAPTLFHHLYRRGRSYILKGRAPSAFSTQRDFEQFHRRAIDHGVESGGTIGPNGTHLAALLLRYANGAVHFFRRGDIDDDDCACNHCLRDDEWCTQFTGADNQLMLLGRCLGCWIANRGNCSFQLARAVAAGQAAQVGPTSKVANFESGRALYRQNFPPDAPNPAHPVRSVPANLLTPRRRGAPRPGPNTPEGLAVRQSQASEGGRPAVSGPSLAEHALARESIRSGRVVESGSESPGSPMALSDLGSPMVTSSPFRNSPRGQPSPLGQSSPRSALSNSPLGPAVRSSSAGSSPRGLEDAGDGGGMGGFTQPAAFSPDAVAEAAQGGTGPATQEAVAFQDGSPWWLSHWPSTGFLVGHHWQGPGDSPRRPTPGGPRGTWASRHGDVGSPGSPSDRRGRGGPDGRSRGSPGSGGSGSPSGGW